jgi:hypothetical protein
MEESRRLRAWSRTAFVLALLALCLARLGEPASAQSRGRFAAVAGDWTAHGFGLSVADDGQAVANWRVYQWCSDLTSPAPCDSILGNEIESGGLAMVRFTSISASMASGIVLMSSDPNTLSAGSSVSLTLQTGGTARLSASGSSDIVLCGPNFDPGQFASPPCGA